MKKHACNHTIHDHQCHFGWNRDTPPVLRIAPGETVEFHTVDSSGGQLNATSTLADLAALDFGKVNPLVGPDHIEGAQPGDAIEVTLLDFTPSGWGWTANTPGFGLLAHQFKDPALHIWKYDAATRAPIVVRGEAFQADPHREMGRYRVAVGLNAKPDTLHGDDPAPADWRHMQTWHGDVMSSSTCPSPRDCAKTRRDPAP